MHSLTLALLLQTMKGISSTANFILQADVMRICGIGQLVDAALQGFNVTIFVYGQTGSGKTFTMSGREDGAGGDQAIQTST